MKVLLISPLPGLDPPCGDITYTQTLLANPPEGVEYETYADAMARGTLKEHGTGKALKYAVKSRHGVIREFVLTAVAKTIHFVRSHHWLFWEPFRFFSVKPGEYDVIHLHIFSARFLGIPCPLVVSSGSPQRYLYTKARHYSEQRANILERCEIVLGRMLGVNVNSYHLPQVSRLMVYTGFAKNWYIDRQIFPANAIDINPIFLSSISAVPSRSYPKRIGFIAKDFEAKGGPTLLRAFEKVRIQRPDAELYIVGCPPQFDTETAATRGIIWTPYVPRDVLLQDILPSFDVFAYPTECDCISYAILEVMSRGIAIATSDYPSMPEAVDYGRAGLVSPVGDSEALADNILRLLEPEVNVQFSKAAYNHFEATFAADIVRPNLRRSYEAAFCRGGVLN